jgi:prefoldin subunit 5
LLHFYNSHQIREIDRELRSLNRRIDRLEYSQISPQEFSRAFDRVYYEIDALEDTVNERCDRIENDVRELKGAIGELNRKFDIVMQYITRQGGAT